MQAKRERTTRLIAGAFKKRSGNLRSDANRRMEEILELFSGGGYCTIPFPTPSLFFVDILKLLCFPLSELVPDTKMGSSRFQRETSFAQEEGDTTRQIAQDLVKANEEEEEVL